MYAVTNLVDSRLYIGSTEQWYFQPGGRPYFHYRALAIHAARRCSSCRYPWYHVSASHPPSTFHVIPFYLQTPIRTADLRHIEYAYISLLRPSLNTSNRPSFSTYHRTSYSQAFASTNLTSLARRASSSSSVSVSSGLPPPPPPPTSSGPLGPYPPPAPLPTRPTRLPPSYFLLGHPTPFTNLTFLFRHLASLPAPQNARILCLHPLPGMLRTTNFRTLQFEFGLTPISLISPDTAYTNVTLRQVINVLPTLPIAYLLSPLVARRLPHHATSSLLLDLLRPSNDSPTLSTVFHHLPTLLDLPPSPHRTSTLRAVSRYLYQAAGYRLRPSYTLSIPFSHHWSLPHVALALETLMRQALLHPSYIRYVMDHSHIVLTSNPKLSHLLDNSSTFTSTFSLHDPFPCCCHDHPLFHHLRLPSQPHLHLRGNLYYGRFARVLHTNGSYTPAPDPHAAPPTLLTALRSFLSSLCHRLPASLPPPPLPVLTPAFSLSSPPSPFTDPHYDPPPSFTTHPLSLSQVRLARRHFGDIVITYMDRDLGCPFLSCPAAYWDAIHTTFCLDSLHYRHHPTLSPSYLINRWLSLYLTHLWSRYFPLSHRSKHTIPGPARLIFKRKDTDPGNPRFTLPRARPIVPYTRHVDGRRLAHPLHHGLRMAALTLSYLLTIIPTNSWTLPATHCLGPFITAIHQHLLSSDPSIDIAYHPFDVKNMFTDLPKPAIKTALRFFFTHPRLHNLPTAHLYKFNYRRHVTLLPPPDPDKYRSAPLVVLHDLLCLDLDQSFFLVGQHVYEQILGIPMGSFTSATIAIATCAYYEHCVHRSLTADPHLLHNRIFATGIRYVDDGILFTAIPRHALHYTSHTDLRDRVVSMLYPPPMTLEMESFTDRFPLLESMCHPHGSFLLIRHHCKNADSIASLLLPRLQTGVHYSTYRPRRYTTTTLIGDLARIIVNTTSHPHYCYLLFRSLVDHFVERHIYQEIPLSLICQAVTTYISTRTLAPHTIACLHAALTFLYHHRHHLLLSFLLLHHIPLTTFLPPPSHPTLTSGVA